MPERISGNSGKRPSEPGTKSMKAPPEGHPAPPGSETPLSGRTVLVTRAALQAGELVREIRSAGATPVLFPTIEIQPAGSWDECDRAIDGIAVYDGLIFTSTNGVRYFCERWTGRKLPISGFRSKLICVVGERTRQTAIEVGLDVTVMPQNFTASDLARMLAQEDLNGKRYLFPRGNLGDDALPGHLSMLGALVDCVIVYQTTKPLPGNLDAVRTMLLEGGIEVATFTSPSTFNNFVSLFTADEIATFRPRTLIAVIGPSTSAAIKRYGMSVDIAPAQSSVEALVQSIIRYFHPGSPPRETATASSSIPDKNKNV